MAKCYRKHTLFLKTLVRELHHTGFCFIIKFISFSSISKPENLWLKLWAQAVFVPKLCSSLEDQEAHREFAGRRRDSLKNPHDTTYEHLV